MPLLKTVLVLFFLCWPIAGYSQDETFEPLKPSQVYQPPTKEEWTEAKLDPIEYDLAVRYEVSLEEWKKMDYSRKSHQTAGWSCIAAGLLVPAIEATVIWGGGVEWNQDPQKYAFLMVTVAAAGALLTGIVVLAGTPSPDDFKEAWKKKLNETAWMLLPSPSGIQFNFTF